MAELADALDLGSSSERSEGSSPFIRTCSKTNKGVSPQISLVCILCDWRVVWR